MDFDVEDGLYQGKKTVVGFDGIWRPQSDGNDRSKVIGPSTLSDVELWTKVGELGLSSLVAKSEPKDIFFRELGGKYVIQYPFNKTSTKRLHEQIVRKLLIPRWGDEVAIEIDPPKLKAWMVSLDVASSTRGKYRSVMSVCTHGDNAKV